MPKVFIGPRLKWGQSWVHFSGDILWLKSLEDIWVTGNRFLSISASHSAVRIKQPNWNFLSNRAVIKIKRILLRFYRGKIVKWKRRNRNKLRKKKYNKLGWGCHSTDFIFMQCQFVAIFPTVSPSDSPLCSYTEINVWFPHHPDSVSHQKTVFSGLLFRPKLPRNGCLPWEFSVHSSSLK